MVKCSSENFLGGSWEECWSDKKIESESDFLAKVKDDPTNVPCLSSPADCFIFWSFYSILAQVWFLGFFINFSDLFKHPDENRGFP